MKTVVVYKSISGFTKKYAEWIAEELEADLFRKEKINIAILLKYDIIIYGGSLHAVGISGVSIIKNNLNKTHTVYFYIVIYIENFFIIYQSFVD